jgi:hypothetical protein
MRMLRSRPGFFLKVAEHGNKYYDENDFQGSFSCRVAAPRSMKMLV